MDNPPVDKTRQVGVFLQKIEDLSSKNNMKLQMVTGESQQYHCNHEGELTGLCLGEEGEILAVVNDEIVRSIDGREISGWRVGAKIINGLMYGEAYLKPTESNSRPKRCVPVVAGKLILSISELEEITDTRFWRCSADGRVDKGVEVLVDQKWLPFFANGTSEVK